MIEQQPGPVNWAPNNIAPRDGMICLWALEAFAHGAEAVSYFRWRQAPFAQEQMHAGLLRPDRSPAEAFFEAGQVAEAIRAIDWPQTSCGQVAMVMDYEAAWAWAIQPQGEDFDYFRLLFETYRSLRKLGVSVDFISPDQAATRLDDYALCVMPGLFSCSPDLAKAMARTQTPIIFGPRSASKTAEFQIPSSLAPDLPDTIRPVTVTHVESLVGGLDLPIDNGAGRFVHWREFAMPHNDADVLCRTADGMPALVRRDNLTYQCGWADAALMTDIMRTACRDAGIPIFDLGDGVRMRRAGDHAFVMNYSDEGFDLSSLGDVQLVVGEPVLPPSGFAIVRL